MLRSILMVLILSVPALASAQSYEIDATFDPANASMKGQALVQFSEPASPSITFYLHGELRVTEITAGGEKVAFAQERVLYSEDYSLVANRTTATLNDRQWKNGLRIEWSGTFHTSAARSPSDYMRIDSDGVFLRARGYSPWFPLFVEPGADAAPVDFRRVTIRVPPPLTAVFAGELVSRATEGGHNVSVWKAQALDLFAAQLTARPFEHRSEEDVHVYSLGDPSSRAAADAIVQLTGKLLRFYREHYRSNAVSTQIQIIETPKFGDISSGNVVGVQEESWRKFAEDPWSKRTLAHELVHPFVNTATPRSDRFFAMSIEGFPSYFHYPALAEWEGDGWYDETMRRVMNRYIEKKRTGLDSRGNPLPPEKPLLAITADEVGKYKDQFLLADRALLMLDDLRRRMGKERFDRFTRELFNGPAVDEKSFRRSVLHYLPDDGERVRLWMETTEYPADLQIPAEM